MFSVENLHIIESLGLVIVSHNYLLDQNSVGKIITEIKENPFFNEEYYVLIDVSNANIKMNSEDIADLSNFVYNNLKETGLKKFAILASTLQLNKAVEFVHNYKQSSKYQVFSTLKAALNWLKIPQLNKPQIEIKLNYLRQKS